LFFDYRFRIWSAQRRALAGFSRKTFPQLLESSSQKRKHFVKEKLQWGIFLSTESIHCLENSIQWSTIKTNNPPYLNLGCSRFLKKASNVPLQEMSAREIKQLADKIVKNEKNQ